MQMVYLFRSHTVHTVTTHENAATQHPNTAPRPALARTTVLAFVSAPASSSSRAQSA